ncbi:hypothetical protein TSUD_207920 [Trifolium subterraneum]|uniref:Cyclic nucleotide-binding domain-containing protein n=1 Tax=Trifolium subterraneum TaxID=3900 RepID=A0A2Z6MU09_TRISU|nr:hypothetical protein TSUD_207920 [Trifolium subterraneum]
MDLVFIVPFELVATRFHPPSKLYYALSTLALLRVFYSTRIHRWFSDFEENEKINFTMVRIAKMIWVCFLVCHYGGCVFYLMATFHANVKDTWFSLIDPNFVNQGLIKRYVTSIYYAVISFTTVGYGDLHPVSRDEQIQAMEPVLFPANSNVILENEAPMFLYFVLRGSVDLIFPDGIVTTVRPGQVFGEVCVFFNTPQVFTATTREWSQLLMLDRVKLLNILEGCASDTSQMISDYFEQLPPEQDNPSMDNVLLAFERKAITFGRIGLPVSLWFAVRRGYNQLFDELVEQFCDPNECDKSGQTAMHLAASSGDIDKVNRLLAIGANPNIRDLFGKTALHVAIEKDKFPMVQYLVETGVPMDDEAYVMAQRNGSEEMINYMELGLLPQFIYQVE